MELWLVDINLTLVEAWKKAFTNFDGVRIKHGNILEIAENTIVSPTNSYGFMDGGIDLLYTEFFGMTPQTRLQEAIKSRGEGYLPVGASVLIPTDNALIPYMICVSTMLTPESVPTYNSFYAMIAVLNTASRYSQIVKKVFCPGLATGVGGVVPELAAQEMANAYQKWSLRRS
ncbi:macro domain-containing protein [Nostoc sp. 106C]|uniref:macro domain-containing protein n=1 Tax=Nostoc sp. 106C TaxID=1932667 RepID=UPI000A3AD996|nr:macro domain-containing protein [Nostoc sp. 106C]OUL28754.1 AraC family transcriptional regulator [Nostoc sp. 106C]